MTFFFLLAMRATQSPSCVLSAQPIIADQAKKVSVVEVISFSSAEVLGRPLAGGLKKHFAKEPCQPTRQRHYLEELMCEKTKRAHFRVYKHTKKSARGPSLALHINKTQSMRMNLAD